MKDNSKTDTSKIDLHMKLSQVIYENSYLELFLVLLAKLLAELQCLIGTKN